MNFGNMEKTFYSVYNQKVYFLSPYCVPGTLDSKDVIMSEAKSLLSWTYSKERFWQPGYMYWVAIDSIKVNREDIGEGTVA